MYLHYHSLCTKAYFYEIKQKGSASRRQLNEIRVDWISELTVQRPHCWNSYLLYAVNHRLPEAEVTC